jgi:hypothetical protein
VLTRVLPHNFSVQPFTQHLHSRDDNVVRNSTQEASQAQQRSSPGTSTLDTSVIPLSAVLIHQDRKICEGEGESWEAFEAQWGSSQVAVKVFNRNVPPTVSRLTAGPTFES